MINPLNFFRKNEGSENEVEEVNEKRTSTLGYLMLLIMAIFVIVVGRTVFSDLERIPKNPGILSYCVSTFDNSNSSNIYNTSNYRGGSRNCNFGEIEKKLGIDTDYTSIEGDLIKISSLDQQINNLERQINNTEREIDRLNSRYDTSLQEQMAGEQAPVLDKSNLQQNITSQQYNISSVLSQINTLKLEKNKIVVKITPTINKIKGNLGEARKEYKKAESVYNIKIFFLKLLFILPIFIFAVYKYLQLKKKNSPYTIIFTAIVTATSILFLEIIFILLYWILPMEFLTAIFRFFMEIAILRYILYYGAVILVIGLFGGIVYYIQKRVYNPENVAMRRLKDNKCPGCSFLINMYYNNCPKCGRQLKNECEHCGNMRISDLPHCPNCGK